MPNMKGKLGFSNKLRGGTFEGYAGVDFDFYPSIGFTAAKAYELEASIKSMRVPLEASVREVMRPSIAENFVVGGRPAWAPLAQSTVAKKGSAKINVDKGKLSKVAAQRNIWDITRTTAVIRGGALLSRAPYAAFVQGGHGNRQSEANKVAAVSNVATRKTQFIEVSAGETPARPYLMIQPEDATKIREIFSLWVDERIARSWGR